MLGVFRLKLKKVSFDFKENFSAFLHVICRFFHFLLYVWIAFVFDDFYGRDLEYDLSVYLLTFFLVCRSLDGFIVILSRLLDFVFDKIRIFVKKFFVEDVEERG